jgi:carboxyl-terminal processing protease
MFASRFLISALAIGAFMSLAQSTAAAQTADGARAFSAIKAVFGHIRDEYVDEIEDTAVFRSAVLGMAQAKNVDARMLDSERIRTAMKLGSRSRNPDVVIRALEGIFDEFRATRRVDGQALVDATIEGVVKALDSHSAYMNPEQWRANIAAQRTGSIGLNVTMSDGGIRVVNPIMNGPAELAGIVAGDVIVAIDEAKVAGHSLEQVVALFRGPLNSEVVLTITRGDPSTRVRVMRAKIIRARVAEESIRFRRHDDVGYIQIIRFNLPTIARLKSAVTALQAGPPLAGYVIDLRDNLGGPLDDAVATTEALIGRGLIATTRGRNDRSNQRFEARSRDLTNGLPMVVLVNEKTAAGAEIMAAALQQHRHATVVGTRSYGAGTIQTVISLGEGSGALRLTTSRIYTASGRPLEGNGVAPNNVVEQRPGAASDASDDLQLQAALKVLRAK